MASRIRALSTADDCPLALVFGRLTAMLGITSQLANRFFRAAGRVVDQAWDLAVGGDLPLPEVPGHRSLVERISDVYMERLLRAAEHDPIVAAVFRDVGDLLAPPQELMRPRILRRVLRENLRQAWVRRPSPRPYESAVSGRRGSP